MKKQDYLDIPIVAIEIRRRADEIISGRMARLDVEINNILSKHIKDIVFSILGVEETFGKTRLKDGYGLLHKFIKERTEEVARDFVMGCDITKLVVPNRAQFEKACIASLNRNLKAEIAELVEERMEKVAKDEAQKIFDAAISTSQVTVISQEAEAHEREVLRRLLEKYPDVTISEQVQSTEVK